MDNAGELSDLPLHKVVSADSQTKRLVSGHTLKRLLLNYGQYPAKHRLLIWRFLLRLPENRQVCFCSVQFMEE